MTNNKPTTIDDQPTKTMRELEHEDKVIQDKLCKQLSNKEIGVEEFSKKMFEQDINFKNEFLLIMSQGKTC